MAKHKVVISFEHVASVDLAWLAGFMDGEGTIRISQGKSSKGLRKPNWQERMEVVNTHLETILEIQKVFGGHFWVCTAKKKKWKTAYRLKWTQAETRGLLQSLIPYLRTKRRQAELVLAFIEHKLETRSPGVIGFGEDVLQLRKGMHDECAVLNKKGATA